MMMRSLSILIIVSAMITMMVEAKPKTYLVETADADHDDPRTSIDSIPEDGYFPPQNRYWYCPLLFFFLFFFNVFLFIRIIYRIRVYRI